MKLISTYRRIFAVAFVISVVASFSPIVKGETCIGKKSSAPAYYNVDGGSDGFFFSWGVPMGGLIQQAERTNPDVVLKLTEKKISANKKAIAKIAEEMNKMPDVKSASAAKRALARFESVVKGYHNGYVSGYDKWPLKEWEAVGELEGTTKGTIAALKDVISKTASEAAKKVYSNRLVELEAQREQLKKRYEKMFSEAMGR